MFNRFAATTALLAAAFLTVSVTADDTAPKEAKKKVEIKCPVSGAKVNKEQSASYKDGEVYFCCKNCKAAFAKDSTKHAVKANAQLVQTEQYEQKKCPFSGGPMKTESEIAGVTVKFCCGKCKKAADGAEGDDQLAMIFGDEAFKKGYVKKKKSDDNEAAKTEG
jgi:YHS domain-containing protein